MFCFILFLCLSDVAALHSSSSGSTHRPRSYSKHDLIRLKQRTTEMFHHSYNAYLNNAYPYDELKPLTCSGVDTWGSYTLTLIDALDTLAIIGNYSEFKRIYELIAQRESFDSDINVSVFETNIRIVGGLISGHLLAKQAGVDVQSDWPCNGPLLSLAEDLALRLLPAFDTPTGMPYGTVNLRGGVPRDETPITATATIGTLMVEFSTLSRLTSNPVFELTALRASQALFVRRSKVNLVGNHIDVLLGKWTAVEAGIGAGIDSYYEYLVKGSALVNEPVLMSMFHILYDSIEQHMLTNETWHIWVSMTNGSPVDVKFQSLEAFWPGLLSLITSNGNSPLIQSLMNNYHSLWKRYGFLPEFFSLLTSKVVDNHEGYPLRPEFAESAMYLYRATKDPVFISVGEDMLTSIEHSSRQANGSCGYATIKNVLTHQTEDRMESFFIAETIKYLYLLFDQDNFIHSDNIEADILEKPYNGGRGDVCFLNSGSYIFSTEAHPIDVGALDCCTATPNDIDRRYKNFSQIISRLQYLFTERVQNSLENLDNIDPHEILSKVGNDTFNSPVNENDTKIVELTNFLQNSTNDEIEPSNATDLFDNDDSSNAFKGVLDSLLSSVFLSTPKSMKSNSFRPFSIGKYIQGIENWLKTESVFHNEKYDEFEKLKCLIPTFQSLFVADGLNV